MRTAGSPEILEYRRHLAVQRVAQGYSPQAVADFLGVDASSVRRWLASFRRLGAEGLTARPVPGRPPKLTATQEKVVRRWLADSPTAYGFTTELWSAPRLALLLAQEFGISLHPDYLTTWLRQRGFTPQKPRRRHRERDQQAIARWLAEDWPRIKKSPPARRDPLADG
jgi:transposase